MEYISMVMRKVIQEKIPFHAYGHIIIYSSSRARNLLIIVWMKFYLFVLVKAGGALSQSDTLWWLVSGGVFYQNHQNQLVPRCTNLLKRAVFMEELTQVDEKLTSEMTRMTSIFSSGDFHNSSLHSIFFFILKLTS